MKGRTTPSKNHSSSAGKTARSVDEDGASQAECHLPKSSGISRQRFPLDLLLRWGGILGNKSREDCCGRRGLLYPPCRCVFFLSVPGVLGKEFRTFFTSRSGAPRGDGLRARR